MRAELFALIVVHQAPDLRSRSKIEEQAYFERCRSKIVQHLRFVCAHQSLSSFQLNQDDLVDNQVCFEIANIAPTKKDWRVDLFLNSKTFFNQRKAKRIAIYRLKKSKA